MSTFSTAEKTNQNYLDHAANGNGVEKAHFTSQAIRRLDRDPGESLHIVEIGPGGGAAVNALTRSFQDDDGNLPDLRLSFVELDGVTSESLKSASESFHEFGTTKMHQGDARHLDTIFPEGADIVTASAVFHEVYSYAGGYDGIKQTLTAVTNTLQPGGYFAYRDVFAVDKPSQHEQKKHIYDQESWIRFAQLFLPYYLENATHPYHREDDSITFEQDGKIIDSERIDATTALTVCAPIGALRELQRHYITFRDHMWRTGILGVTPELEGSAATDWLDMKTGHKRVHYRMDKNDQLLMALSEYDEEGRSVVDGDVFDATTDALLGHFLKDVINDDEIATKAWKEWLQREGSETYVYMTLERFIASAALRSLQVSDGKKVLLPTKIDDITVAPRAYYNRFLQRQLNHPLFDGKQLALLQAVDLHESPETTAQALNVISDTCSKETLAKLYAPIRKIAR